MQVELIQNLIEEQRIHPKGTVLEYPDAFARSLIAREIAVDAGIGAEIRRLEAEAVRQRESAREAAAEIEAERIAAQERIAADARVSAAEDGAKHDARKRGTRGIVVATPADHAAEPSTPEDAAPKRRGRKAKPTPETDTEE